MERFVTDITQAKQPRHTSAKPITKGKVAGTILNLLYLVKQVSKIDAVVKELGVRVSSRGLLALIAQERKREFL
jgi:hypothetical protein